MLTRCHSCVPGWECHGPAITPGGAEPSQRSKDDSALIAVMKKIHEQARESGVRRMRAGGGAGPTGVAQARAPADAGAGCEDATRRGSGPPSAGTSGPARTDRPGLTAALPDMRGAVTSPT